MNYIYLVASGVSVFGLIMHLLLGRRPSTSLEGASHSTSALDRLDKGYGRHMTALLLFALAVTFVHASRNPSAGSFAFAISSLGLAACLMRLILAVRYRAPKLDFGEWIALAAASGLGLAERAASPLLSDIF